MIRICSIKSVIIPKIIFRSRFSATFVRICKCRISTTRTFCKVRSLVPVWPNGSSPWTCTRRFPKKSSRNGNVWRSAEADLKAVTEQLKKKQQQLHQVESKIKELQDSYDHQVAEKKKLEISIMQTQSRLKRASKLTTALADEQIRWKENITEFQEQMKTVTGNVFVSSACVAYYGAFPSSYRQEVRFASAKAFPFPTAFFFRLARRALGHRLQRTLHPRFGQSLDHQRVGRCLLHSSMGHPRPASRRFQHGERHSGHQRSSMAPVSYFADK